MLERRIIEEDWPGLPRHGLRDRTNFSCREQPRLADGGMCMDEKPLVIVTAAGGPMGAAIARRLAAKGTRIICADRRPGSMAALAEELAAADACGGLVHTDLRNRDGAHELVGSCLDRWGRIDGLVNVVGGVKGPLNQPLWEITPEQWSGTIALSLDSAFHCISEVLPTMMARRGGHIVNIGSTSWSGSPERAHYAAAKAGLVALTRSAATQLGPYGITVNLVAPGGTLTTAADRSPVLREGSDWRTFNPLGRPNRPEDVAAAVAFLMSADARNISGQVLTVAGGLNPSL
jgi:NAD(P)-dependent dehydrogenase (short-subunit alcohol dehydrogenase family)